MTGTPPLLEETLQPPPAPTQARTKWRASWILGFPLCMAGAWQLATLPLSSNIMAENGVIVWGVALFSAICAASITLLCHRKHLARIGYMLRTTASCLESTLEEFHTESTARKLLHPAPLEPNLMLEELRRLHHWIQHQRSHHQSLAESLARAEAQLTAQARAQEILLTSSHHSLVAHYQSVMAYADYLNGMTGDTPNNPDQHFDFDDVCESAFSLKLMAGALAILRDRPSMTAQFHLSDFLQHMLLSLTPSLDRRAMHFNSTGMHPTSEIAIPPTVLSHALWMILLGMIRYAEAESTLSLCCTSQGENGTLLTIGISELTPAALTPSEREAHFTRQTASAEPSLFAETIRVHTNLQLASLLLIPYGITLSVAPQTAFSCDIHCHFPAPQSQ